ncbi:MAG: phytanoyl-CoA dioxygenase family protein [Fimbriimonadaceae bacterium]|nr:phytanoyl-CoA dioxygenase family protein [Fimbriimonadaceae bacterium]
MRLRDRFETDGYVVVEDFLAAEDLVRLNAALDEKYAQWQAEARQIQELGDAFACDVLAWDPVREGHPVFCEIANSAALDAITYDLLGDGYGTQTSLIMFSVPGGRGQAWHQDCPPDDAGFFNLNRLIYPRDATLDRGAIVVVPGSHRLGPIPPGDHQESLLGEVVLTPRAGTLVLLHGHVYHRVTPNLTDEPRNSVNFRALPPGVPDWVTCVAIYRTGRARFCDTPDFAPATYLATP